MTDKDKDKDTGDEPDKDNDSNRDKDQPRDERGRFVPNTDSSDDKPDVTGGFEIKYSEIPDDSTREAVRQMQEKLDKFSEIEKSVQQMKEERDNAKRSQLLGEIEKLSPHLAEKSKEKSIEQLVEVLETAQEFKGVKKPPKHSEQDDDSDDSTSPPEGVVGNYDPATGKWVYEVT